MLRMLRYYDVENYRCYDVTLWRCCSYGVTLLTMLRCCNVTILRWYYNITLLRCYALTMFNTLLRCYDRVWTSSMYGTKRGLISLLNIKTRYITPRQKRPSSHDFTASFRSVYNTEPKAAVIPWLNGFVSLGIWYWAKSGRYPMTKRLRFVRYIIPSQKWPAPAFVYLARFVRTLNNQA